MAILYVDYENGNDNYGGTSFALLASGTDGRISSSTFSSVTASFPNDGSLINQYLSIFNGTIYAVYQITAWVSATQLTIAAISGGTALANQTVDRQYYIGGAWKTSSGLTSVRVRPSDTVRFKASPSPTSIGNASWTDSGRTADLPVTITSSNTTPIVVTTNVAHGLVTGDYVRISTAHTQVNARGVWLVGATTSTTFQILQMDGSNTVGSSTGSSGTARKYNSRVVKTASALVKNIALCGGSGQKPAWTASANVTATQSTTTWKEGFVAAQLAIAAGFTTGKAAYYTLPTTLDLSSYQQVSFWIKQTAGTVASAGQVYLALCTDTTGDTVVHQCPIPAVLTVSPAYWRAVTVNLGTNLNSAIRSVAFYVVTDLGAQTFVLDNIIACKAASANDSVSLQSLISKSDGTGDGESYVIQSINHDVIQIANNQNNTATTDDNMGYIGTTETVTTYKREPFIQPTTGDTIFPPADGSVGSPVTYSGGWNRTDMSTRTGVSWYSGVISRGYGFRAFTIRNNLIVENFGFANYLYAVYMQNGVNSIDVNNVYSTCSDVGFNIEDQDTQNLSVDNIWTYNNIFGTAFGACKSTIGTLKSVSNTQYGIVFYDISVSADTLILNNNGNLSAYYNLSFTNASNVRINYLETVNSVGAGIVLATGINNYVNSGFSANNASRAIGIADNAITDYPNTLYLNNFTINEATILPTTEGGATTVYANRLNDTDGNNWVYYPARGTVNQQTAVVDSPATTSWQMRPTGTTEPYVPTELWPITLKLGTVVCAASSLVTVTARMRRDNTGLTMRLICPGGQIVGVASDVYSDMTAVADTWETVTITFTPTKAGAVDIYAYAFGGSTYSGYVCNLTASQA